MSDYSHCHNDSLSILPSFLFHSLFRLLEPKNGRGGQLAALQESQTVRFQPRFLSHPRSPHLGNKVPGKAFLLRDPLQSFEVTRILTNLSLNSICSITLVLPKSMQLELISDDSVKEMILSIETFPCRKKYCSFYLSRHLFVSNAFLE
ncbi:hypothetical protein TNCV_2454861 [Trichonephila clavipes]|nr:hypothetical protein TNCV_2454861 [Trichonephila clavipes]